jgi:TonB-linked SusC/RagA family outer membrane protein
MDLKILLQLFVVQKKHTKELFRIMRLTTVLLFVGVFQLLAINTTTKAQNITININANVLSVGQLLDQIEHQSDYLVVFRNKEVDTNRAVSFHKKSAKLETYLDEAFRGTDITYSIDNKYILLYKKSEKKESASVAQQEGKRITGTITDKNGEPIIGANIVEKGTTNGTISDANGKFSLAFQNKAIIVVSYIGYQQREFTVAKSGSLNITLMEDSKALDEVVVVGYGTQKRLNVTGAVSMVGTETFKDRPVSNVTQALQGAIPGLNISTNNRGGEIGQSFDINIRGTGTIGNGSTDKPLILIDGLEGSLNSLNPNDIESISVLKDAASASIYGTRAAFGVILVTTKSGKEGKVKLNYSGNVSFASATNLPRMANSLDWANYFNTASINSGGGTQFTDETMEKIKKYLNGEYTDPTTDEYWGTEGQSDGRWMTYTAAWANTDWYKVYYRNNAPSTQHTLSASGGNEKVNWIVSGGYYQQNGLIRHGNDELNRYTMNSKINAEVTNWMRLVYSTKWTRTDWEKPQYLSGSFYHNATRRWPTNPLYDRYGHYMGGMEVDELENGGVYENNDDKFVQQLQFLITPLKDWTIHIESALSVDNSKQTTSCIPVNLWLSNNTYRVLNSGYGTVSNYTDRRFRENYYSVNVYSDYFKSYGLHHTKALIGVNFEKYSQDWGQGYGTNLTNDNFAFLSQTTANAKVSDAYWHRATAGYFGRLNYDYNEKYLLEFNLRYDGSSRFLKKDRWKMFPSLSGGWNIAKESFFASLNNYINTFKLRASWGQLGNTNAAYGSFSDWYPFYQQQSVGSKNSAWLINGEQQNTASLPGIINSSLTWETIETVDVGFDWAALHNRLSGSFDIFNRTTKDMVGPAPVLGSVLGVNSPYTNNTKMRSRGWELEIRWKDQIGEVHYGGAFSLSDATQKILSYPYEGKFENQSINGYYNGKQLGEIWGYESAGIANSNEEMTEWLKNNKPNWGSNWGAGDIMYKNIADRHDASGNAIDNGVVNSGASTLGDHGDLKVLGNNIPRYRFGINLNAEYKGLDFSIFMQGVMKRDYLFGSGQSLFWGAVGDKWQSTCLKEHLDYWSEDNQNAYYPKPYLINGITKNQYAQDRYLQNAAYMRCKNIQLGYSIPQRLIRHIGLDYCRFYISCENLFTITSMSDIFDPEVLSGDNGAGQAYPLQRTVSFGVNITL